MASTYNHPQDYISWFIKGNHLAVVTIKGEIEGSYNRRYGQYKPIDQSVTNGLLIHYYAEPNAVTTITDTPDVDNVFHTALVDYVKARLYQDKAGRASDGATAGISLNLASIHEAKYNEAVKRNGMQKRDKTGGDRRIMMPDFT